MEKQVFYSGKGRQWAEGGIKGGGKRGRGGGGERGRRRQGEGGGRAREEAGGWKKPREMGEQEEVEGEGGDRKSVV